MSVQSFDRIIKTKNKLIIELKQRNKSMNVSQCATIAASKMKSYSEMRLCSFNSVILWKTATN